MILSNECVELNSNMEKKNVFFSSHRHGMVRDTMVGALENARPWPIDTHGYSHVNVVLPY